MNWLCSLGRHKWIPRARAVEPRREVALITMPGSLFVHPSCWPRVPFPYIKRFEKIGEQCARCKRRRK